MAILWDGVIPGTYRDDHGWLRCRAHGAIDCACQDEPVGTGPRQEGVEPVDVIGAEAALGDHVLEQVRHANETIRGVLVDRGGVR